MANKGVRENLLKRPVIDLSMKDLEDVATSYVTSLRKSGGFTARYLVRAADILYNMFSKEAFVAISFPANIVATGLRGLLADLLSTGAVSSVITTGGTFDHDIARGTGKNYFIGDFELDDVMLRELEIHRLGNILIPYENYGPPVEEFTHNMLDELTANGRWRLTPSDLAYEAGKRLRDTNSILAVAAEKGIPVFSPGIVDGAFGTSIYTYNEIQRGRKNGQEVIVDVIGDMKKIAEYFLSAEKLGGILLGGGISKHHLIWWAQFRGGLDYAVAFTTAPEWDGSLSGARTREAITWGKIKPSAAHVTVPGDLTVVFPLIITYAVREAGY